MANHNARLPKTIRIPEADLEKFGVAIIGLALMDPAELAERSRTVGIFKSEFPDVAILMDFDDVEDDHIMVFDQGTATRHRFVLPALYKLVPMIREFLGQDLEDYKLPGEALRTDIGTYDANLKGAPPGGAGYDLPEVYARAALPNTDPKQLTGDDPELFYNLVGDYAFKGCR